MPHASGKIDYIIDTLNRRIDFTYEDVSGNSQSRLTKIQLVSIDGQTIHNGLSVGYNYTPVNPNGVVNPQHLLCGVAMPAGASDTDPQAFYWSFFYNEDNFKIPREAYELKSILTPYGIDKTPHPAGNPGETTYIYANFSKVIVPANVRKHFRGVAQKTITPFEVNSEFHDGGSRGKPLTWSFQYETGQNYDVTTITDPNNEKTEHYFYGFSTPLGAYGLCWAYGLEVMTTSLDSNDEIKKQINTVWESSNDFISYENHRIPYICNDSKTYIPRKTKETVWKEGVNYTTSYADFDSYGNPGTIVEQGNLRRQTQMSYWYNPTRNIVNNKVLQKTVTGSQPGSFTETYAYDDFGRQMSHNLFGVLTNYTYDSGGNLATVTDANQNTTVYDWQYGKISNVTNPMYSLNRVIAANGTITSETDGQNNTTQYEYDRLLRVTKVSPPLGNPTYYTYHFNKYDVSYKQEQKGGIWSKSYFDGQGRVVHTENNLGITSDTYFYKNGRKNYSMSNTGDTTYFDFFGRPSSIIHHPSGWIQYPV